MVRAIQLENLIDRPPRGNPRKEQPAKQIENLAFGKDPNHDLLRALQVSDTETLDNNALEIGTAWTVTLDQNSRLVQKIDGGQEYKNFVQQIRSKQHLTFTVKIDDFLFRDREKKRLRFNELQEETLCDIAEVCRSATHEFTQREQEFFTRRKFPEIANRYDELIRLNETLPEGAFLLQIGWGTGYRANTVAAIFADEDESPDDFWMDLRERFRLGESRSRRGQYDPREFPKTRRVLYRGRNPIAPLGWVKISPLKD